MIHVLQCEDAFDDGKKAEIKKVLKNNNFFSAFVILKRENVVIFCRIFLMQIFYHFGTNYFAGIGWEILLTIVAFTWLFV